jgi:hypothetical protein
MSTPNHEGDQAGEAYHPVEQLARGVANLPAAVWAGFGVVGYVVVAMGAGFHGFTLTFGGLPRLSVSLSA